MAKVTNGCKTRNTRSRIVVTFTNNCAASYRSSFQPSHSHFRWTRLPQVIILFESVAYFVFMEPSPPAEGEVPADTALLDAQSHIARIRREKFDNREGQELTVNAKSLSLRSACKHAIFFTFSLESLTILHSVAQQLNGEPTHFLLEFIQNADDNFYITDVVPSLSISCRPGYCQIDCNETGFQPSNVDAICNIGQSTKTNRASGFIVRKGLDASPSLRSPNRPGSIQIPIPCDAPLSMVAPMWADFPRHIFGTASLVDLRAPTSNNNAGTQFLLQLDHGKQAYVEKSLHRQLYRLHSDSVLLLFLRSLRSIRVSIDDLSGKPQGKFLNTVTRQDYHGYGGEMVRIGTHGLRIARAALALSRATRT
jgi:hypothetical protein